MEQNLRDGQLGGGSSDPPPPATGLSMHVTNCIAINLSFIFCAFIFAQFAQKVVALYSSREMELEGVTYEVG